MKTDYDLLSSAPPEESCVDNGDAVAAREEGKRYITLLRKVLGNEPDGSQLKLRSNPHDFGTYITVSYYFDDDREDHIDYMQRLDNDGPLTWDDDKEQRFAGVAE